MATSNNSRIEPFDCVSPNLGPRWKRWFAKFELYADSKDLIIVTDKDDNKQRRRAMLLHLAGEAVQDIFDTLPGTGGVKDYTKACDALNAYFVPKTNTAHARHEFKKYGATGWRNNKPIPCKVGGNIQRL